MNSDRDIVIIGCGAGGGTAAQFARKTDRKASITVFEKGKYPQYSKCGLPYAISDEIPEFENLIEFSEEWFKKANIDLLLETIVEKIDTEKQIIFAKKGNNIIEKSYGSLIICTGAKPFLPPIQNLENNGGLVNGVFTMRTIDDAKNISSHVQKDKNVAIIGAGLIGLEMADTLHRKKMKVTVVETLPHILANTLTEDISELVHKQIPSDVSLFTNHLVTKIESENGKINQVIIKNNETGEEKKIDTNLLIIATGCKPEVSLAKDIDCKIGETSGIVVNSRSETNVKNIYAVGDCTEYLDFVTKKPLSIGLGSIVVRQGIAAGINAAGGDYRLPQGVLQTCTSEFFDMEIAAVGPTSGYIKNMSVISGKFNGSSLPEYFPGGKSITIKIIVDEKTGRILAAQAVGDKAAQRINTFACAILGGMNVETFRKLETAYAPPVAPTLDVITLVCDIVSMKLSRKQR
ncbi:NAD(FAD)-dependent dehydrogenase [Thermoplasmatales archaeon SCGC AB-539-N05]|nr:NAD(FAD)-dependent dehydrogenase [Thermoplasmatales archaeon SCGC AB-539-N05]